MEYVDLSSMSLRTDPLLSHYGRILRFIRDSVPDAREAEDLVQETYLRFFRARITLEGRDAERFLYRIARNLLTDRYRRWKTLAKAGIGAAGPLPDAEGPAIDPVVAVRDEIRLIEGAIAGLGDRCRRIFLLHRFGGLTYAEIAKRFGISQGAVEKQIAKAIVACRDAVER